MNRILFCQSCDAVQQQDQDDKPGDGCPNCGVGILELFNLLPVSDEANKLNGQLEIDSSRGVIYFHDIDTGTSKLRIQGLPTPVPIVFGIGDGLDIAVTELQVPNPVTPDKDHMFRLIQVNWSK